MISLEKAIVIATDCARALRIAGLQADVPYSQAQLCETIAAIKKALDEQTHELKQQLSLSNRRYAALNARHIKLTGKPAPVDEESGS